METTNKRNYCFDCIKGIACIFVVFMHCEFPGLFGVFVQSISRFCVPFFFMISGYFCYAKEGVEYQRKIKHIAMVTLGAVIFYLVVTPIYDLECNITSQSLIKWLLFNVPPYIASQLWFLFALLYDYLLFAFIEKRISRQLLYMTIPGGIILYILLAQGFHLLGFSIPNLIYRNFLIEGFPLFTLGFYIHEHKNNIDISNKTLAIILLFSTLLSPVERLIMGRDFGINIVSFPQVIALFLLGLKNPCFGKQNILNWLGKKHSMYVYIIHPAILNLLIKTYALVQIHENLFAIYMQPILCVLLTILCSVIFVQFKSIITDYIKRMRNRT